MKIREKTNTKKKIVLNFFSDAPLQIYEASSHKLQNFSRNTQSQMIYLENRLTNKIIGFFQQSPQMIIARSTANIYNLGLSITVNNKVFYVI